MEEKAERIYNDVLENIMYPLVGRGTTFSDDLKRVGCQLFGSKFAGVFASDELPELSIKMPYTIINLDKSSMQGSHWIAVVFTGRSDTADNSNKLESSRAAILVYDSFGRDTKTIIPSIINKYGRRNVEDADDDAEQHIFQDDCGQRSLAFLYVADRYGSKLASYI